MLDFRKGLFALAIAGLGLVGTASAQQVITCNATSIVGGVALGIHAEGVTEQLPGILISGCTGMSDSGVITVTVTSNGPITNATNLLGTGTDAIASLAGWSPASVNTTGAGSSGNVIAGTLSGNVLTFTFKITPDTTPGTITIGNVRINATTLPTFTTYTETAAAGISGLIFASGTTTTQTVAVSQTTLAKPGFTGYQNLAICNITSANVNAVGYVVVADAFTGGFETDSQELAKEPPVITAASGGANVAPATAANTVGTTVALTFGNLSNNATYYLPTSVTNTGTGQTNPTQLVLVSGPTTVCGVYGATACALAGGTIGSVANTGAGTNLATSTVSGVYGFTPTNGGFTAYYRVVQDNYTIFTDTTDKNALVANQVPATTSAVVLYEVFASPSTAVLPTGAPTVQANVVGNTSPLYAEYTTTGSPTVSAANPSLTTNMMGIVTPCNTTLLFPYIITTQGYDTGIAITNASLGTSVGANTIAASPSPATCTLQAWGAGSINGTAVTPFSLGTFTVAAGQVYAANLSMLLPSTQPTFAGYAVATCNFQGGQGFAQISNQASGFSEGYLAPILGEIFEGTFAPLQVQN